MRLVECFMFLYHKKRISVVAVLFFHHFLLGGLRNKHRSREREKDKEKEKEEQNQKSNINLF